MTTKSAMPAASTHHSSARVETLITSAVTGQTDVRGLQEAN
ncbi:hypothetical protein [Roseivirga echinicomitans]|nr:hypothetical protein [Roseivirga echinicomitans]